MNLSGMMPQAPSSDTMGWFSRDAETFARVSSVLLGETAPTELPSKLLVAVDAFGFAHEDTRSALEPMVKKLGNLIGNTRDEVMAPQGLSVWGRSFSALSSSGSGRSSSRISSVANRISMRPSVGSAGPPGRAFF